MISYYKGTYEDQFRNDQNALKHRTEVLFHHMQLNRMNSKLALKNFHNHDNLVSEKYTDKLFFKNHCESCRISIVCED